MIPMTKLYIDFCSLKHYGISEETFLVLGGSDGIFLILCRHSVPYWHILWPFPLSYFLYRTNIKNRAATRKWDWRFMGLVARQGLPLLLCQLPREQTSFNVSPNPDHGGIIYTSKSIMNQFESCDATMNVVAEEFTENSPGCWAMQLPIVHGEGLALELFMYWANSWSQAAIKNHVACDVTFATLHCPEWQPFTSVVMRAESRRSVGYGARLLGTTTCINLLDKGLPRR